MAGNSPRKKRKSAAANKADVTRRSQAPASPAQWSGSLDNERLLELCHVIFRSASEGVLVVDSDGLIRLANDKIEEMFGYERDELIGNAVEMLVPEHLREVHVRHRKQYWTAPHSRPMGQGMDLVGRRKDGTEFPMEVGLNMVETDDANLVVGLISDITARSQTEEALRHVARALHVSSACSRAIVQATDESELLPEICRIIVEIGGYRLAWVGLAEQNEAKTVRPVAKVGYEEGYLETLNITWADTERGRGPTGKAIRTGRPSAARHIPTDPDYEPWRAEAVKRGYASSLALPMVSDRVTFGALNVYASEPDAFDAEETHLLAEMADCLAYGLVALRAVAQRKRAEEALQASESVLRGTMESAADGVLVVDSQWRVMYVNRRFADMWSFPDRLLETRDANKLIPIALGQVEDPEALQARIQGAVTSDEVTFDTTSLKDGRVFEQYSVPLLIGGEVRGRVLRTRDITARTRAEEALERTRDALEGKVERQLVRRNPYGLTFREFTVLNLVAAGKPDKEIAHDLGISLMTAHKHVGAILGKMNASSRTDAAARALREGLIE